MRILTHQRSATEWDCSNGKNKRHQHIRKTMCAYNVVCNHAIYTVICNVSASMFHKHGHLGNVICIQHRHTHMHVHTLARLRGAHTQTHNFRHRPRQGRFGGPRCQEVLRKRMKLEKPDVLRHQLGPAVASGYCESITPWAMLRPMTIQHLKNAPEKVPKHNPTCCIPS